VFEERVLRRVFGLKNDEVAVQWRGLYKEGFNDMYFSLYIFPVNKNGNKNGWGGM
jgi:hypothetical protein